MLTMIDRIFKAILWTTLVVCIVAWTVSYWDVAYYSRILTVRLVSGSMCFGVVGGHEGWHVEGYRGLWTDWWRMGSERTFGESTFDFPIPLLVLFTAGTIGWSWFRNRSRIAPGYCSHCRYPMKGLPHKRCPECGAEL